MHRLRPRDPRRLVKAWQDLARGVKRELRWIARDLRDARGELESHLIRKRQARSAGLPRQRVPDGRR